MTFSVPLISILCRVDNIVLVLSEVSAHGRASAIVGYAINRIDILNTLLTELLNLYDFPKNCINHVVGGKIGKI